MAVEKQQIFGGELINLILVDLLGSRVQTLIFAVIK
jgi:hypothetical protein